MRPPRNAAAVGRESGCDQPCAPERSVRFPRLGASGKCVASSAAIFPRFSRNVASLAGKGVAQAVHCDAEESLVAWQLGHSMRSGAIGILVIPRLPALSGLGSTRGTLRFYITP